MSSTETIFLGVILERRQSNHPWQDHAWRPVAVVPGAPEVGGWRELRRGEGWVHYLAGTLPIELHRKFTDIYRFNLAQEIPRVFVVLRPNESDAGNEHEVFPLLLTADPYEAENYLSSGDAVVEGVPMPDEVTAWVRAFVDEHHVDVPFKKRQRESYDPRRGDFSRRGGGRPHD